jgi:dTDP-4-dehydrorhamnose reductase
MERFNYDTIINAAAYTSGDGAESTYGRREAWLANVAGVSALAGLAARNRITLVHVSSDYVFDGQLDRPYQEGDAIGPLGVYGRTKAAGDAIVATVPRPYIIRTSCVIVSIRSSEGH